MKIKPDHLKILKTEIDKILEKHNTNNILINEYETGNFDRSKDVKDLQKRFCFDLLYGAGLMKFVCDTLYIYMNDDHLYTALKKVCPKVTRKY